MRITDFRPRQSKEAAQIAAAAFADDPLWTHTLPDPERRRLPHLIMLGTALRRIGPPQVARVALDGDRIIGFSSWTAAGSDDLLGGPLGERRPAGGQACDGHDQHLTCESAAPPSRAEVP